MGILKKIFGPSKDEIWQQIADEIGGEFIDAGFWGKDRLEFEHKEWTIVLDTFTRNSGNNSSTTYTRIRAPFVNKDNLYFDIYTQGFFSAIGKFFGMQDIETGDAFFDEAYVIKSNSQTKVRQLLKSDKLKELISYFPNIEFGVKDQDGGFFSTSFPDGIDMLYFESYGVIKDKDSLLKLFLLFSAVLERLVQIDSAYEDDPNVNLK